MVKRTRSPAGRDARRGRWEVFEENFRALFSLVLSLLGQRDAAEEVMLAVAADYQAADIRHDPKGWLFSVAKKRASQEIRRRQRDRKHRDAVARLYPETDRRSPEEELLRRERMTEIREGIWEVFQDLQREDWELFELLMYWYAEGCPRKDWYKGALRYFEREDNDIERERLRLRKERLMRWLRNHRKLNGLRERHCTR